MQKVYTIDPIFVKKEKPFSDLLKATMFARVKQGNVTQVGYIYKVTYYEAE